jgi:hypothetical protein
VRRRLGFGAEFEVETRILEIRDALNDGVIRAPYNRTQRNAD